MVAACVVFLGAGLAPAAAGMQLVVAEEARLGCVTGSMERSACAWIRVFMLSGVSVSDWKRSCSAMKRPAQYAEFWAVWIRRGSVGSAACAAERGSVCVEVDDTIERGFEYEDEVLRSVSLDEIEVCLESLLLNWLRELRDKEAVRLAITLLKVRDFCMPRRGFSFSFLGGESGLVMGLGFANFVGLCLLTGRLDIEALGGMFSALRSGLTLAGLRADSTDDLGTFLYCNDGRGRLL